MKTILLATLLASASVSAFALTTADQYGSAASAQFTGRTIVIDSKTRYVNVQHGETVTFRAGDSTVSWHFDGISQAFDLSKILPAAASGQKVDVYVAPEMIG
ncbi:MAG: CzcE family metal-binding protein [Pseudomonadota bacterium]|nr:CzcE family metal-binding protein [Pseudomonadota bacterium]